MSKQFNETSSSDYTPSDPKQRTDFMTMFAPRSAPESELARYRILSDTAGVRVSPLCLGAMSLGDQWTGFMAGKLDQKESEEYLDEFVKLGGNFIDTANNYQDEQSEHIIGEWMEKRGNRDDIVLATKYTSYGKTREGSTYPYAGVNQVGNAKKNLKNTVEQSLKRLRTSYLDILYVHWWDHSTSIPELMQSLNDLVRSGKVLYLGISDTPAWVVSQANEYARQKGFAQFVVFQGLWNLSVRDMERDIIPMCRNNGMALAPWGVLGQGKFKTEKELKERATLRGGSQPTETDLKTSRILQEIADEIGGNVHLAHVAMAWVRSKYSAVYPIIGGTSLEQLRSNAEALKITLTPEQVKKLDDASPFDPGFPTGFFGSDPRLLPEQAPQVPLITVAGHVKYPKWA